MKESLNILVVEDDILIGRLIEKHLRESGHRVLDIIHNSEIALDKIHNLKPDLILLDINIEGTRDGIEIGLIIKEKYNIPFIFLSALSDPGTLNRAREAQPCAYLVKPYKAKDLYTSITIGLFNFRNRQQDTSLTLKIVNQRALDPLTEREFELLQDIVEGLTNSQISAKENLSLSTVKWHLQNIYSKLGVKNRTSAVSVVIG